MSVASNVVDVNAGMNRSQAGQIAPPRSLTKSTGMTAFGGGPLGRKDPDVRAPTSTRRHGGFANLARHSSVCSPASDRPRGHPSGNNATSTRYSAHCGSGCFNASSPVPRVRENRFAHHRPPRTPCVMAILGFIGDSHSLRSGFVAESPTRGQAQAALSSSGLSVRRLANHIFFTVDDDGGVAVSQSSGRRPANHSAAPLASGC